MNEAVLGLVQSLKEELSYQQQMEALLNGKLEAMRRYDMARLEGLTVAEKRLVETERLRSAKRERWVLRLTRQFCPEIRGRLATAKEIAAKLPAPFGQEVMYLAVKLKETTERLVRLNQINASVTRKLLGHVDSIFKIVAQAGVEIGLYSRAGRQTELEHRRLIDALA